MAQQAGRPWNETIIDDVGQIGERLHHCACSRGWSISTVTERGQRTCKTIVKVRDRSFLWSAKFLGPPLIQLLRAITGGRRPAEHNVVETRHIGPRNDVEPSALESRIQLIQRPTTGTHSCTLFRNAWKIRLDKVSLHLVID